MNYAEIKYCDIANGEGVRTTLFVSGCRRGCPGCFNPEAFSFSAGKPFTPKVQREILDSLAPGYVDGLTFLGGEPFEPENQEALIALSRAVRKEHPNKTIWCYTGFTYESLIDPAVGKGAEGRACTPVARELLGLLDILVDGPFQQENHDITLRFRGSSNQRIIDVPRTLATGNVVLWHDDPLFATHAL